MAHCAVNTGLDFHLLDHIAPLAALKKMPLIVTEELCATLCAKYYPEIEVQLIPDLELRYREIAAQYDSLTQCRLWSPQLKLLFLTQFKKEMQLIFCPHGQSDKGYGSPVLNPYAHQDLILLYGSLLKEMLIDLNIWPAIKAHAFIGNYRLTYYEAHQERHCAMARAEIFSKLNPRCKTLLYAPTWNDADEASSFFKHAEKVIGQLPAHWNLLIKLHPLLEQRDPALFYRIAALEQKKDNLLIVDQFPLIYPILDAIDAYLGDYSSIGYDLLAFEKPMFFIPQRNLPAARLHRCGTTLNVSENIFETIDKQLDKGKSFAKVQRDLYQKAFINRH